MRKPGRAIERLIAVWHRLLAIIRRRRLDQDLDAEIAFHLSMREAEYRASGASADAARYAARRRFGNVTHLKERTRDMWTFPSFESVRQDVRYALRALRRSPAFSSVAIVVLAIGIAGNTAMFSLVDAVRLRALPYAESDRLVILWGNVMRAKLERRGASYPDFVDWRSQATTFEGMAAGDETRMTLSGSGDATRILVETVSASYFSLLRVNAAVGRTFAGDEDVVPQKVAVVVLSDGFWRRQLGADPQVVGRPLVLDARPYTVIGIMQPGFRGVGDRADVWIPFVMSNTAEGLAQRGSRGFQVLARLNPGVSRAQAQAELDAISHRLEQAYPDTNEKRGVEVSPLDEELLGEVRPALRALMIAVAFVLLIACANVANLLLARSEARQREIAVRMAIGAGWSRLFRQLVTESCVLTGIAAVLGLGLAAGALRAVLQASPVTFPSFVHPHINLRVALFTAGVSVASAVLLGLAPAMHGRVSRLADALKESARGSDGTRARTVRSALVVAEVSLAVLLLIGAGLMIRTVQHLVAIDPGFNPDRVLTARVSIPRQATSAASDAPAPLVVAARTLLDRVRALPGVTGASLASDPPLSGLDSAVFYSAEGQQATDARTMPRAYIHRVMPDFFATIGIPLRSGRTFMDSELTAASRVVLASEHVATRFWPGQDPVGKRIKLGGLASQNPWLTIVGVVGEVKYRGLPENPTADPDLYFPFIDRAQQVSLVVRTNGDPASLVSSVRQTIRDVDPGIPVFGVFTMTERIADQTAQARFTTWIMGAFAGMALVLSAIGIYGVMSYLVSQRTREVGIRMALGATRREIVRLIVGHGARLIGAGVLIGAVASVALQRLMATLIYRASILDGATAVAIASLTLAGLLACYLPALRAASVDPLVALRAD
jgi:putative ABC transport system permease protein